MSTHDQDTPESESPEGAAAPDHASEQGAEQTAPDTSTQAAVAKATPPAPPAPPASAVETSPESGLAAPEPMPAVGASAVAPSAESATTVMETAPSEHAPSATGDVFATAAATPGPSTSGGRERGRGAGLVAAVAVAALAFGAIGAVGGSYAYDALLADDAAAADDATSTLDQSSTSNVNYTTDTIDVQAIAAEATESVVVIEMVVDGSVYSIGSGFVIRDDGYILTNAHVVDTSDITSSSALGGGSVDVEYQVTFSDGTVYTGDVVGSSTEYDLAVVQIDATGLPALTLADSDALVVGDPVVAVGSPLGLDSTVTSGIVSALHRPVSTGDSTDPAYIDAIQTDAAINQGNSGGPLLNGDGEVVGIVSAIATATTTSGATATGSIGLGFAITSNQARITAEELIATGEATYPAIGVYLDSSYVGEGVLVMDDPQAIVEGGPGDLAGLEPGDVITAIDGRAVAYGDELIVAIRSKAVGDTVTLTVERGDEELEVELTLVDSDDLTYALADDSTDSDESDTGTNNSRSQDD